MSKLNQYAVALLVCTLCSTSAAEHGRTSPRSLRVCADPANLPFSNEARQGFENEIAALMARELHAELAYTWWAQRRGFFRNTLNAGLCDVVIGVPTSLDSILATDPYYRSTFAVVSRSDRELTSLRSLDDPRLRKLKIGIALAGDDGANPAPAQALARRGLVDNLVGFSLFSEYQREVPAAVQAVADGSIDIAILWGPVAGAGAQRSQVRLKVEPIREDLDAGVPLAFSIAMGVRRGDTQLAAELSALIRRKRAALAAILRNFRIPMVPLPELQPESKHAPI